MAPIDVFLTAYDPSDLPGGSIDPLGFDRGYTFLADKILPGLTNVANRPRYFGMLCAGVALAGAGQGASPTKLNAERRQAVLCLERFWALANFLAAGQGAPPATGVRGIRYVSEEVARLRRLGARSATAQFKLLSRQEPYGVLGIYGNIAEDLRLLIDRRTFELSPDAGDVLARAFIEETEMPGSIQRAVREGTEVSLSALAAWGARAHIGVRPGAGEARCLGEALHRHAVRSRAANLFSRHPPRRNEKELARMERIARKISDDDADLKDAFEAILAFEETYRVALLGFERIVWLCRQAPDAVVSRPHLERDEIIRRCCTALPRAVARLEGSFASRRTAHLVAGRERVEDVRRFLERAVGSCDRPLAFCEELHARHVDVQRGKFDRGRRKMPWVEWSGAGVALTTTRAGGLGFEAKTPDDIQPHPYRVAAVDALIEVAAG